MGAAKGKTLCTFVEQLCVAMKEFDADVSRTERHHGSTQLKFPQLLLYVHIIKLYELGNVIVSCFDLILQITDMID